MPHIVIARALPEAIYDFKCVDCHEYANADSRNDKQGIGCFGDSLKSPRNDEIMDYFD